eukprot:gene8905-9082_t
MYLNCALYVASMAASDAAGITARVEVLVSRASDAKVHYIEVSELRHAVVADIEEMQVQLVGFRQRKIAMAWLHQDSNVLQQMEMALKGPGLMSVEAEIMQVYLAVMKRVYDASSSAIKQQLRAALNAHSHLQDLCTEEVKAFKLSLEEEAGFVTRFLQKMAAQVHLLCMQFERPLGSIMLKHIIWLDCDPGHDDAMALVLAGYSPHIKLLGVSTVASNQTVEKTTRNALDVLDLIGLSRVNVVMGQHKPLMRSTALLCPEIHGETGLDGPEGGPVLPHTARQPLPGKAPIVMFQHISWHHNQHPEQKVQLICTGALTNAALLLLLYPEVQDMIEVTIMGGALGVGNTGPVQEFNIQVDPEAAKIVFESGVPLTMVPLETTHTALATSAVLSRMFHGASTPFKQLVEMLLTYFATTYRDVFNFHEGAPLHDPCAVAAVFAPDIFEVSCAQQAANCVTSQVASVLGTLSLVALWYNYEALGQEALSKLHINI